MLLNVRSCPVAKRIGSVSNNPQAASNVHLSKLSSLHMIVGVVFIDICSMPNLVVETNLHGLSSDATGLLTLLCLKCDIVDEECYKST